MSGRLLLKISGESSRAVEAFRAKSGAFLLKRDAAKGLAPQLKDGKSLLAYADAHGSGRGKNKKVRVPRNRRKSARRSSWPRNTAHRRKSFAAR